MAMKRRNFNTRTIDGEKLRRMLKERGVTLTEASITMGYNPNAFAKYTRNNYISPQALMGLEFKYEITYEDIKPTAGEEKVEEITEAQTEQTPTFTFSAEELQEIIRVAVKDAVKEAILESRNVFSSAMYDAINN